MDKNGFDKQVAIIMGVKQGEVLVSRVDVVFNGLAGMRVSLWLKPTTKQAQKLQELIDKSFKEQ